MFSPMIPSPPPMGAFGNLGGPQSFGGPQPNPMMGGCGCGGAGQVMDPRMMQMQMQMQMLQMMEQMVEMLSLMMGGGGFMGDMMGMPGMGGFPGGGMPGMPGVGAPNFGGGFPSFGGAPGFGGGAPSFGGPSFGGGPAPMGPSGPVPGGQVGQGGQAAVDLGRRFLGRDSWTIKGQLPNFTAAGGRTNNCADFVSSLLQSTGALRGHHVNVRGLERALQQQGYRQIPASQAKPGDVWINHSRGHTELVTAQGGTRTIGSNNIRQGHQQISERPKNPNSGVYYSRG